MKQNELNNLSATATKIGVTQKWLLAHAENGTIPSLLVGKKRLFNIDAVRAALAEMAAQKPPTARKEIVGGKQ